ncbi:unnamed protein product [Amoebophrya sp. A25]|nr:unnamed protein product [Amoebophrya sp. A25]|eukprot:GSA25T00019995001.1
MSITSVADATAGVGICLLVNSAYGGLTSMTPHLGKPFWEKPISTYDESLDIGARSAFLLSRAVIPKMAEAKVKNGLIVQISSYGGFMYVFELGYSVGHVALDRLSWDMAIELNSTPSTNGTDGAAKIRSLTLSPAGGVTEVAAFPNGETPIYVGRSILALHADSTTPDFLDKANGKVLFTADLASKTLAADGIEGATVIKEDGKTDTEADEINKARAEALKAFPGPPKIRGENDPAAPLPQMADGFAVAGAADFFPGLK